MTSSFAQGPSTSSPYTQHHRVRKPVFGEIRSDSTNNNALYPTLVNYVDSKILGASTQLKKQATITSTTFASGEITLAAVLGGLVHAEGTTIAPAAEWSIDDVITAFKAQFGRNPKVGDGWYFTTTNTTAANIAYKATDGQITNVAPNTSRTLGMYFISPTAYAFIRVSRFSPVP